MKPFDNKLVGMALLAGMFGSATTLGAQYLIGNPTGSAANDAPVAVVNLGGLVSRQTDGNAPDPDALKSGFETMKKMGEKLADEGYIVLDGSSVVQAPDRYYVPERSPDDATPDGTDANLGALMGNSGND